MDNLHFLPNNILTWFSKELTKYKNDYISIVFKLYIYINYIIHHNIYLLNISIHIYAWGYKLIFLIEMFMIQIHLLSL